jgi:hypothetical protein
LPMSMNGPPLLLMFLIHSALTTFADMPRTGSGSMSGCKEPCLVKWLTVSFPSIHICPGTHTSWIVTFCHFHQELIAVPD